MYLIIVTNLYESNVSAATESHEIVKDRVVIGRTRETDIALRQTDVSKKHAAITVRADGFYLEDLGSSNGTLLNDAPVNGPVRVYLDDEIKIGGSILKLAGHDLLKKNASNELASSSNNASANSTNLDELAGFSSVGSDPFWSPSTDQSAATPELPPFDSLADNAPVGISSPSDDSKIPDGNDKISLDALFPFHDSNILGTQHPVENSNTPFPVDDVLPPAADKPKPAVSNLMDKIRKMESKMVSDIPASCAPESAPVPAPVLTIPPANISPESSAPPETSGKPSLDLDALFDNPEVSVPFPEDISTPEGESSSANSPFGAVFDAALPDLSASKDVKIRVYIKNNVQSGTAAPEECREFTKTKIDIGRSKKCDLMFPVPYLSSSHVTLEATNRGLIIEDTSRFGTYVNSNKIAAPTSIGSHDLVVLGPYTLRAEMVAPADSMVEDAMSSKIPSLNVTIPPPRDALPMDDVFPPAVPQGGVSTDDKRKETSRQAKSKTQGSSVGIRHDFFDHLFNNNILAITAQLQQGKAIVGELLKHLFESSLPPHQIRTITEQLAGSVSLLYSVKLNNASHQSVQDVVDASLEYLDNAVLFAAQNSAFQPYMARIVRAVSLLYPLSSTNRLQQDQEQVPPVTWLLANARDRSVEQIAELADIEQARFWRQPKHGNGESVLSTFRIQACFRSLNLVANLSRSVAELYFLNEIETLKLINVVDEACTNAIEHAYQKDASCFFELTFVSQPNNRLKICVDDRGAPFNVTDANSGKIQGMGLSLLQAFCTSVSFENRGKQGKRLTLVLDYSEHAMDSIMSMEAISSDIPVISSSDEYRIMSLSSDQGIEISKCAYTACDLSFNDEIVYIPERLEQRLKDGCQISAIAFTPAKVGIGHLALVRLSAQSQIGELAQSIIAPAYSSGGVSGKLTAHILNECKARGITGVWKKLSTIHIFEQSAFSQLGAVVTGLLNGEYADGTQNEQVAAFGPLPVKRSAQAIAFLNLANSPEQIVFLPDKYQLVLQTMYQNLGLNRNIDKNENGGLAAISEINVSKKLKQGCAYLTVAQFGDDFVAVITRILSGLAVEPFYSVFIDLPLTQFGAKKFKKTFETLGFYFAALIPGANPVDNGDILRLQQTRHTKLDFSAIQLDGEWAKGLSAFIEKDKVNVDNIKKHIF